MDFLPNNPTGHSTSDKGCVDFLSRTYEECLKHHTACAPKQESGWIPTRLLDLQPRHDSHDRVALVERSDVCSVTSAAKTQYVALSHVWGSSMPFRLTKSSYAQMKTGTSVAILPQCYRDAVYMTRKLEIRYLWIDSLW